MCVCCLPVCVWICVWKSAAWEATRTHERGSAVRCECWLACLLSSKRQGALCLQRRRVTVTEETAIFGQRPFPLFAAARNLIFLALSTSLAFPPAPPLHIWLRQPVSPIDSHLTSFYLSTRTKFESRCLFFVFSRYFPILIPTLLCCDLGEGRRLRSRKKREGDRRER